MAVELRLADPITGDPGEHLPDWSDLTFSTDYEPGTLGFTYPIMGRNAIQLNHNTEIIGLLDGIEPPDARWLLNQSDGSSQPESDSAYQRTYNCPSLRSRFTQLTVAPSLDSQVADNDAFAWTDKTPGDIIITALNNALSRARQLRTQNTPTTDSQPLTWLTLPPDFTATQDSAGLIWPSTVDYTPSPGTSIADILDWLTSSGLAYPRMQGRTLQLFHPDSFGTDRTGGTEPVVLATGRDFTEASYQTDSSELVNALLVTGDDPSGNGPNCAWVYDQQSIDTHGYREGTLAVSGIATQQTLKQAGNAYLSFRKDPRWSYTYSASAQYLDTEHTPPQPPIPRTAQIESTTHEIKPKVDSYEAWPNLFVTHNGTWLLTCTSGKTHVPQGSDRKAVLRRSTDQGASWTITENIGEVGLDWGAGPIGQAANGDIIWITQYQTSEVHGETTEYVFRRSIDDGRTFSTYLTIDATTPPWDAPAPFGEMLTLHDGTIIVPWSGRGWGFLRSDDHGASWTIESTTNGGAWNAEAYLVQAPDGTLISTCRAQGTVLILYSTDTGHSWTRAVPTEATPVASTVTSHAMWLTGSTVHLVWISRDTGGFFHTEADLSELIADPTAWEPNIQLGTVIAEDPGDLGYPAVAPISTDEAYLVWYADPQSNNTPSIYGSKLSTSRAYAPPAPEESSFSSPRPFLDFGVGDTVLVLDAAELISTRVRLLSATWPSASSAQVAITINDLFAEREVVFDQRISRLGV